MIKNLIYKYKHIFFYLLFGVLTTLTNIIVYWFMAYPVGLKTVPSSVVAWIAAVTFAYLTNRKWVFGSDAHTTTEMVREVLYFFACRLGTGILDWVFMYVTVDIMNVYDVAMKLVANIIVVVLNYIASKLLIFKKKQG